jgi:hypothetical protein
VSERRSLKSIALEYQLREKRRELKTEKKNRRHKFGATRVKTPGQTFDSKLEAAVFQILLLREKAGEIKNIRSQVTLRLTRANIGYRCDFVATDCVTGQDFGIEGKGDYPNAVWDLKKRLYKFYGPFKLEIWKGSHTNPQLIEVITPVMENSNEEAIFADKR